jgi:hypothetical protein
MRVSITCDECGRRHRLERTVHERDLLWIVCHDCELTLRVVVEAATTFVPVSQSKGFADTWATTLYFSPRTESTGE